MDSWAEQYRTPYRYGRPLVSGSGEDGRFDRCSADCPFVFYHGGKFRMMYVGYDGRGYQTALAESDDLLHWEKNSEPLLSFGKPGDLDEYHAHKPCVLRRNGTLYHFYCASGRCRPGFPTGSNGHEFRCIAVAASKPFDGSSPAEGGG